MAQLAMICAGALACVLALALSGSSGRVTASPLGTSWPDFAVRDAGVSELTIREPLAACEERLERAARRIPTLAIVGASYTAGVGPDNPDLSWAVLLAHELRWNAVVYGVSGAGYVRTGTSGLGPVARLLGQEGLPDLSPALVIVQAGHDDQGVPAAKERQQVGQAVHLIRGQAPRARISLLTVFTGAAPAVPAGLKQTDQAIVTAGKSAYPHAIIMDPLAGRWKFPRVRDGLHPTAAGDRWIAAKVAAILRANGILPVPLTKTAPVICDTAVGVPGRRGAGDLGLNQA